MSLVILKLVKPNNWDNLVLVIRNGCADSENNIVPSGVSMVLRLSGDNAKNIFYQLAMFSHEQPASTEAQTVKIGNTQYTFSYQYWEALYSVLYGWVMSMSMASIGDTSWVKQPSN